MYRNGKWACEIIALQEPDGKWGCFHSLAQSYGAPMTTEQALRRLQRLGYTVEDECIRRAVNYMENCMTGTIPDYREKFHDWDLFTRLMLSVWIRRFTDDSTNANAEAEKWAAVITAGFESGEYNPARYEEAYRDILKPTHGTLLGFCNFYHVSLLAGCLDAGTESVFLDHILHGNGGIYYIYEKPLTVLPESFESRAASRYLAAMELLAGYRGAQEKLDFVTDWLEANKRADGTWDMGKNAADKVYFPLSDSWRKPETRIADCTWRVRRFLGQA